MKKLLHTHWILIHNPSNQIVKYPCLTYEEVANNLEKILKQNPTRKKEDYKIELVEPQTKGVDN